MAQYVKVSKKAAWDTCGKCSSEITGPFWWARSKHAPMRLLCDPCHDRVMVERQLAYEMFKPSA